MHNASSSQGITKLASITSTPNEYNNYRIITEVDLSNINVEKYLSAYGYSAYIKSDMSKCKTYSIWLKP